MTECVMLERLRLITLRVNDMVKERVWLSFGFYHGSIQRNGNTKNFPLKLNRYSIDGSKERT